LRAQTILAMRGLMLPPPKLPNGPYVMGVLNVTPNSFSDGGQWTGEAAIARACAMLDAGADIIDVGGESTRPGAEPVGVDEEIARVAPVIRALRSVADAPISVDTMKPEVARAAMEVGATMWNDVQALRTPGALEEAASLKRGVILMHMQGEPRTMQNAPYYDDVVAEVILFLRERVAAAEAAGLTEIWIDPGIGFGKTLEHNLALLQNTARVRAEVGKPILIGASRKRFIQAIDALAVDAGRDRLGGSLAAALWAARGGADIVRVHDVAETVQALKVWRGIEPSLN
jgi:dihydropteroate synthase